MVKNKYRPKKPSTESDPIGPKKTPIVSPHEFDGLIGFEEVKDYTLIKGRFGKKTKQVFKDGKLIEKKKRIRKKKSFKERQLARNKINLSDNVITIGEEIENGKSEKNESVEDFSANDSEKTKEAVDTKEKNKNKKNKNKNKSISGLSADSAAVEEIVVSSEKNESTKGVLNSNSEKSKEAVDKKEKQKNKDKKNKNKKNKDENEKNKDKNEQNKNKNEKNKNKNKKNRNKKNKKRNISESSVDSALVEEIVETDEGGVDEGIGKDNKSQSQKRKVDDEHPSNIDVSTNKKARYNTSVYKGSSDGNAVDVSAWKEIFTPSIVMEALADLGFSQPTEIQRLTLPAAIKGRKDIVGAAETGSGKTLAFGIPIIHGILHDRESISDDEEDSDSDSGLEEETGQLLDASFDGKQEMQTENRAELETEEEMPDDKLVNENDVDINDEDDDSDDDDMEFIGAEGELEEIDPDDLVKEDHGDESENDVDINEDEEELAEEVLEDEVLEPLDESGIGCVKVIRNVNFDEFLQADAGRVANDAPTGKLRALIVTPTRELAIQVKSHLDGILVHSDIKTAVVVGGMSQQKQERLLRRGPEIVVGTPGRLWEMVQQGNRHLLKLPYIKYLAIDETDRMLERGHFQELHDLLELINSEEKAKEKRQTFVFSATLSIVHTAPKRFNMKKKAVPTMTSKLKIDNLMSIIGVKPKPKIVDVTRQFGTAEALTEARINCSKDEKDYYLYYFLKQYPGRTLVFCNSIDCVRRLQNLFTLLKCNPQSLHASMHQKQRLKSLERFTSDPRSLLLATDVAARGLDIPLIQHVIHYQVPRTAETYVHRSGRTARATQEGLSILMVDSSEMTKYKQLCTTLNRTTDLPPFPTDLSIMSQVKKRVNLGREVEKMEHTNRKTNAEENWFRRAAKEAELYFEEEELDEFQDRDKTSAAAKNKQELKVKRAMLNQLISHPLISANFSGKYPTKTGSLLQPLTTSGGTDDGGENPTEVNKAISVMKKENVEYQSMLKKVKVKAPVNKVNKKKNKGFEKRRLKKEKEKKEQLKAMEREGNMESGSGRRRGGKNKDSGMETFSC